MNFSYDNFILLPIFLGSWLLNSASSADLQQTSGEEAKHRRLLKILVYSPAVSWSHAQFMGRLADTLQAAGHEVHFLKLLVDPQLRTKNETSLVHRVHLVEPKPGSDQQLNVQKMVMVQKSFAGSWKRLNFFDHPMQQFGPMMAQLCQDMIENRSLLDRLAAEHFDVGIGEMYEPCPVAILHRLGVKVKLAALSISLYQSMARLYGIQISVSNHFPPSVILDSTINYNVI